MTVRLLFAFIRRHPWESVLFVSAGIANVALLTHDLRVNPQADLQLSTNMFGFASAFMEGTLGEFLLTVRKYPLLPSLMLGAPSVFLLTALFLTGAIADMGDGLRAYLFTDPWQLHLLLRTCMLATAIATVWWTSQIADMVWRNRTASVSAAALLSGSLLWTLYGTAVRPHVPVAAAVTLCFLLSLRHLASPSGRRLTAAFGAAAASFCMLQNGLLAFVFPVWAAVSRSGLKRGGLQSVAGVTAGLLASVALGYPFFLRPFFGLQEGFDLEMGHNHTPPGERWSLHGISVIARTFLESEWLLLLGIIAVVVLLVQKRTVRLGDNLTMIVSFLVLYYGIFGVYSSPHPRYFLATFPLLAALGAGGVAAWPGWVRNAAYAAAIIPLLLLASLAVQPNSYRLAERFLLAHDGTIGTDIPPYLLGMHPTKASLPSAMTERERWTMRQQDDLPGARTFVGFDDESAAVRLAFWPVADDEMWRTCGTFGTPSGGPGMLWAEIDKPLSWLFTASALGPFLTAQCRR